MAETSLKIENLNVVMTDLEKIAKSIKNPKERRAVLQTAARVVASTAEELTPTGKPRIRDRKFKRENSPFKLKANLKYTYKKGVKKAGKGKGNITGQYGIGNLKTSIQVITKIKAPVGVVGPLRNKKTNINRPSKTNSNGWYAAMLFGSAEAFGKKITQRALALKQTEVYNIISNKIIMTMNRAKKNTSIK
jgi:hypothetical protein